jgi:hypothetical protein
LAKSHAFAAPAEFVEVRVENLVAADVCVDEQEMGVVNGQVAAFLAVEGTD